MSDPSVRSRGSALSERPAAALPAVAILLVGALWSWFRTTHGPVLPSGDSFAYLESARTLFAVHRYGWMSWGLGGGGQLVQGPVEVNTIWPPGLSAVLAGLNSIGIELQVGARAVAAVSTGVALAGIFVVARLVLRSTTAALVIVLLSFALFDFQWWVAESLMAEGLWLALVGAGIVLFHVVASRSVPSIVFLPLGLLLSAPYYVKSVGPAFILAAGATVLVIPAWSWRRRLTVATFLTIGCSVGVLPWLLRNLSYGTIGSNGQPIAHPIARSSFDFIRLLVPYHGPFNASPLTLAMAALLTLLLVAIVLLLGFPAGRMARLRAVHARLMRSGAGAIFSAIYVATFLLTTAAGVALGKTGWIETRYWMEIAPMLFIFGGLLIRVSAELLPGTLARSLVRLAAAAAALIVIANVREVVRTWPLTRVRLPNVATQASARAALRAALPAAQSLAFVSNDAYRVQVETGITTAATVEVARRNAADPATVQLVYLAYPVDEIAEMTLVRAAADVPAGWVPHGTWGRVGVFLEPRSAPGGVP